jgi:hypothetical protein
MSVDVDHWYGRVTVGDHVVVLCMYVCMYVCMYMFIYVPLVWESCSRRSCHSPVHVCMCVWMYMHEPKVDLQGQVKAEDHLKKKTPKKINTIGTAVFLQVKVGDH